MIKMSYAEIINNLESAIRKYKDAKHFVSCIVDINILKEALDTIKEQESDIEELKEKIIIDNKLLNDRVQEAINSVSKANQKYVDVLEKAFNDKVAELKTAKSEAIKEFAERLKETITKAIDTYYTSNGGGYYLAEDTIEDIDNLVKEMTEVEE